MADTDPLEFKVRTHPDLDILEHGLTLWDLDRKFPVGGFAGERLMALRDILGVLRNSYCRTVGVEYMHITDPEEREWLQQRIEVKHEQPDREKQKHVLGRLNAAEAFETFLQTKYVGQKRFSLEGGESVIPILDEVLIAGTDHGLDEVAIGMAHRGRLNVLANVLGKSYAKIFGEFEGNIDPGTRPGLRRREVPPRRRRARSATRSSPTPRSPSRWPATRATSRRSTRCSRASCAPSRT